MHIVFPFIKQTALIGCGPACLNMISTYYGKDYSYEFINNHFTTAEESISLKSISNAANRLGFKTMGVNITLELLKKALKSGPAIIHWNQNHFVVVFDITESEVYVADPSLGINKYSVPKFQNYWKLNEIKGICLLFELTEKFFDFKL